MNILEALFTKPRIHSVPRFHAATKRESAALRRKRTDVQLQLAVYVATVPLSTRKAETEAYMEAARD
jgi:hypothetical protein